ncbi:MAG TPA: hypothetical protein VJV75_07735 [Candidatus Polarisedimenticolia bacterium]|nr:hypothetical protein [Candidatus Polarisedimenticolia bacterium]
MRTTRPGPSARRSAWRVRALLALVAACLPIAGHPLLAQSSPSYRLTGQVLNAGGRPEQAIVPASPAYRLSIESIGGEFSGSAQVATTYRLAAGLAFLGAPPGEVSGLQILGDEATLQWSAEPRSMAYNVYRGNLAMPPGGFGVCVHARVEATVVVEAEDPPVGAGFFYLVTGESLLEEEGTKGSTSAGTERPNPAPCP